MSDMLKTFSQFPKFFERIRHCTLYEISPFLRNLQYKKLKADYFQEIEFDWIINSLNLVDELAAKVHFQSKPIQIDHSYDGY